MMFHDGCCDITPLSFIVSPLPSPYYPCHVQLCIFLTDILECMRNLPYFRFIISAAFLSIIGFLLFIVGAVANEKLTHLYLFWNLFLAWVPLLLSLVLYQFTKKTNGWNIITSFLLVVIILFLPNTFYMLTGYIHVTEVVRVDPVFDSVLFGTVIPIGFSLGIVSLLLIHKILLHFIRQKPSNLVIGIIIAASSFAIYLGRELRFNSWDVLSNPVSLIGDILQIITQPQNYLTAYITTLTFFVVISSIYICVRYMTNEPTTKKS